MPQRDGGGDSAIREVEKVANEDVDEDVQVVGVKIFLGWRVGKGEIEKFED